MASISIIAPWAILDFLFFFQFTIESRLARHTKLWGKKAGKHNAVCDGMPSRTASYSEAKRKLKIQVAIHHTVAWRSQIADTFSMGWISEIHSSVVDGVIKTRNISCSPQQESGREPNATAAAGIVNGNYVQITAQRPKHTLRMAELATYITVTAWSPAPGTFSLRAE